MIREGAGLVRAGSSLAAANQEAIAEILLELAVASNPADDGYPWFTP
jgi:hypothetical protein